VPEKANEQHYEVPSAFFGYALGQHRKYSSCFWDTTTASLNDAESAALGITCERAELADGQSILELGCGWGSLSLFMAARYPGSRITAVSNSHSQREYILSQAAQRGLSNLSVITCDMNDFVAARRQIFHAHFRPSVDSVRIRRRRRERLDEPVLLRGRHHAQ
jgi:cyclopropane-fatty-acyl-phospholipid synthase